MDSQSTQSNVTAVGPATLRNSNVEVPATFNIMSVFVCNFCRFVITALLKMNGRVRVRVAVTLLFLCPVLSRLNQG